MSDIRTFLNDPILIARSWPGLKKHLFDWLEQNRTGPFGPDMLHTYLFQNGLEVKVGPHGWQIKNEMSHTLRTANSTPGEDGTSQAYSAALDWLQREVNSDEDLAKLIGARDMEIIAAKRKGGMRQLLYQRTYHEKKRGRGMIETKSL